jgi:hypothetical protein
VVNDDSASFNVCFDFHCLPFLLGIRLICSERRRVISSDGGDSPPTKQAKNEGQIAGNGAIFLPAAYPKRGGI